MGTISFDDFAKLELRIGTIIRVEEIEGADKLWKLTIDLGTEQRTVCAGVKEHYTPDELEGVQVPVVANLAPRTLKGVESRGMVLMAVDADNTPVLLSPIKNVPRGTIIR